MRSVLLVVGLLLLGCFAFFLIVRPARPLTDTPTKEGATAIDHAPDKQALRQAVIQQYKSMGILDKVECRASTPHDPAQIWIMPAFRGLKFDLKQALIKPVYDYCYVEVNATNVLLLKDALTGKTIGAYGAGGLELQ